MNILFICDEYPPGLNGGIGSITQVLGTELMKQGHQVFVAGLYSFEYGQKDCEEDNGIKIWRVRYGFNFRNRSIFYKIQRKIPSWLKALLFGKRDFKKYSSFISQLIEEHKIDIIEHPDWITYGYFIGLKNPALPKLTIPLVLKFHGSHSYSCHELSIPVKPHFAAVDKALFWRADAMVAVSAHNAAVNQKLFNTKREIAVLYNSIKLPVLHENQQRLSHQVLYAGSLVATKGVFSLMKAWNIVVEQNSDARLVVFGKGQQEACVALLNSSKAHTVLFKGHQPRNVLLEQQECATIAVFPSYTEAFSLAPLESMSRACPTIFTKRSSGHEVIKDGINGFLIDPDNIEEIAEKILLLLADPDLRERFGRAGRREIEERFEIGKSAEDHVAFYKNTINKFKSEHANHN